MQKLLSHIGPLVKDELAEGLVAAERRWEQKLDTKLEQMEVRQQRDYDDLESQIRELNERMDKTEDKHTESKTCIDNASKALEVAEKEASGSAAPRKLILGSDGDRVDLSIVHISAGGTVISHAQTQKLVATIASQAGLLPQHFKVSPEVDSRRFTVQFDGPGDTPSRRVTKFLQCQRTPEGKWAEHFVGGTKVFIDPDRSRNDRRRIFGLKQALAIFQDKLPSHDTYKVNKEFKIKANKQTLAVVEIEDGELTLKVAKKAEELGLVTADAKEAFLAATSDQTEWV